MARPPPLLAAAAGLMRTGQPAGTKVQADFNGTFFAAEVVQVPTLQGELHVFSRGLDGGVWHKAQVGGAQPNGSVEWNQWRSLGGATRLFNC